MLSCICICVISLISSQQILPDSEANKDVKGTGHKGKQKFKVKEMYLTKLLSTKVNCKALFWGRADVRLG